MPIECSDIKKASIRRRMRCRHERRRHVQRLAHGFLVRLVLGLQSGSASFFFCCLIGYLNKGRTRRAGSMSSSVLSLGSDCSRSEGLGSLFDGESVRTIMPIFNHPHRPNMLVVAFQINKPNQPSLFFSLSDIFSFPSPHLRSLTLSMDHSQAPGSATSNIRSLINNNGSFHQELQLS